jgi:DNA invertase Pin-like site-specific DNA recombinase
MKVALYARVSLNDVDEKGQPRQNPENQLIRLRAYAKDRAYEIFGEYVDKASGADARRPALDRMLSAARAHRFSMILTTKVDRIARSTSNLYAVLTDLESSGVKFECSDQDISTNSPTGKLLLAILAGVAEFERELIVDRTKAGLARARAQGKRLGRRPDRKRRDQILALRAQGFTIREVAAKVSMSSGAVKQALRRGRLQKGGAAEK